MDLDAFFERSTSAKSTTYIARHEVTVVGPEHLSALKAAAAADPFRRARINLHRSSSDALHQMIIAHQRDSYTRPHRHRNKSESFNILEGRMAVIFFDDAGNGTRRIILGAPASGDPSVYRLSASEWHSVLPLTEFVVFHEITNGPFVRGDSDQAAWAPDDGDVLGARAFQKRMADSLGAMP